MFVKYVCQTGEVRCTLLALTYGRTANMSDKLHDTREAQQLLGGIGRTSLFQLIKDGQLGTVKVGRRRMVPDSQIQQYISRNLEVRGKRQRSA